MEIPVIGQTVSHYKILEKLGEGGMGVVYKARDLKLDRPVALKFLPPDLTRDPKAKQRFIREAKAASTLQHNNICTIHDIDADSDGRLFIVMDYYDGKTLKERIGEGPLPIGEAVGLALQIAQGLSAAHQAGIVHRDIKPANVFIARGSVAKILDFGLARHAGQSLLTRTGSTLGTVAYMSPEQAKGESVDERSDIWSLGIVLYEMLGGHRPYQAEYEHAVIYSILNAEPEPLSSLRPELPLRLEQIVVKCMMKDPEHRYAHTDDIIADLRSFVADPSMAGATPADLSAPKARSPRRIALPVPLAIFSVIAIAVIGYVFFFPRGEDATPFSHLKMIAVLPFENLGAAEDEYFADGLTEEISSRLGSVSGLGVISRQSTMQYKKSKKTLPVVAKELGVAYALTATIRWVRTETGQRIRITPHLIQVAGDLQLWSESYDRTLDDIFLVQAEIASHVVGALGVALREGEKGAIDAIPTRNLGAYEAYLRANAAMSVDYEETNGRMAIEMLERAVSLDSSFALAYVGLSRAHLSYYWAGFDRTADRLALCRRALEKAVALQPDMPEALGMLAGFYYHGHRDYEQALATIDRVAERLPNDRRIFSMRAYIWRRQGRFDEAVGGLEKAAALDPRDSPLMREVGNTLFQLGRYLEAERYFDRAISLSPEAPLTYIIKSNMYLLWKGDTRKSREVLELVPTVYSPWRSFVGLDICKRDYPAALECLTKVAERAFVGQHEITPVPQLRGFIYRFQGNTARSRVSFDSARVWLESEIKRRPEDERLLVSLGLVLAGLGRKADAIREAERAVALLPLSTDAVAGVWPLIGLAQVHTLVGNHDAALDRMEFLLSLPAPKYLTVPLLRLDPVYDGLRNNRRFQALLARYG